MNITLYTTADDVRTVNKALNTVKSVTATPTEPMNILTPTLIINYDNNVLSANYVYIPALNRYYYIDNMDLLKGNRLLLTCRVDVLKTYEVDIKASKGLITKQRAYNPYYGDYAVAYEFTEKRYNFDNVFTDNGEFILVALRG